MAAITIDCWLIVSESRRYTPHGNGNVRLAMKKPSLNSGELPIRVKLEIPGAYFQQPQFSAKIVLPALDAQQTDVKIESALKDIRESVEKNIGIKITFESESNG